jgi:hypothetical protein
MDRRNTQVSYHALALFKITVSIFKDRVTSLVGPRTAAMRSPTAPKARAGIAVRPWS